MANDEDIQLMLDESAPMDVDTEEKPNTPVLYKKWFRTATVGGFLTVSPWPDKGMVSIDIGEVQDGKLTGATKVWVSAIELSAYLDAVISGRGAAYKDGEFVHYGGKTTETGDVSRVFKVVPDGAAFSWRCGHFKARKSSTGAFIPDMKSELRRNLIRVSAAEMHELALRLRLALHGWASNDQAWVTNLNVKDK